MNLILKFFYKDNTLKNPALWLINNILGNNPTTGILPIIGFGMESQKLKGFLFCILFRKNKWHSQKIDNTLFWGLFSPYLGKNWIPPLFSIYSSLTSWKKSEKNKNHFSEKLLTDGRMKEQTNRGMDKRTNTSEIIGPIQWNW